MPSSFVLPEYLTPVTSFITRMSAPTITPFEGSTTRPLMLPFGDCAARGRASDTAQAIRKAMRGKHTRTVILLWPTDSEILFGSTERGLTWYHSFLNLVGSVPDPGKMQPILGIKDDLGLLAGKQRGGVCRLACDCRHSARS